MHIFAICVYILCVATSGLCAALLVRSYARNKTKLLLYTALCFGFLAVNNFILFLDLVIFPRIDLMPFRQLMDLAALGSLLYGFIWEAD